MNRRYYIILLKIVLAMVLSTTFALALRLPEPAWAPLAALLMIPTQIGAVLREGIISYLIIVITFLFGSFLISWVDYRLILLSYFLIGAAVCLWVSRKHAFFILLILMIAVLVPFSLPLMLSRLLAITLGAGIGIIVNLVLFPPNIEEAFRSAIVPLLKAYSSYFNEIIKLFLHKENSVEAAKKQVEKNWLRMPNWVYQTGFSIAFQAGHRHFVIRVEQVAEILCAAHYLARERLDEELAGKLQGSLLQCAERVQQMFATFIQVLYLHPLSQGLEDFLQEIESIEKEAADDMHLASFVAQLKDLHFVMLKMAEALR